MITVLDIVSTPVVPVLRRSELHEAVPRLLETLRRATLTYSHLEIRLNISRALFMFIIPQINNQGLAKRFELAGIQGNQ